MHGFNAEFLVLRIYGLGLLDYNIDIIDGINGINRSGMARKGTYGKPL